MTDQLSPELPAMPVARPNLFDPPLEYHQLRDEQPLVRVRFPTGIVGWLVTRFEEGSQVFADPRMSVENMPAYDSMEHGGEAPPADSGEAAPSAADDAPGGDDGDNSGLGAVFVRMDDPAHGAYRRLLTGRFTPKAVATRLQPYIDRIVDEHLSAMESAGADGRPVDLIEALALPIPCLVICEILGVPYEDRDGFHHATETAMDLQKSAAERRAGMQWLVSYIATLVGRLRADPDAGGLLAELIAESRQEGSILGDGDIVSIGALLLFAGHDTTVAMLGLSVLTLLTHQEQRDALSAHPEKIGTAVEELLRYLTIVQFGLSRVAKEDVEIGGQQIRKGELVVVAMPAANRDPRVFDDPDVPDLDRKMARHLAFGWGVHQCLGQNVARAEMRTVIPRLFERFPDLRLATPVDEVVMDTYGINYGVKKMLVTW